MREIKFRAWNKENNLMLKVGNPFNGYYTIYDDGVHYGELVTFGNDLDKYEFMQYTGLKDKNGKEIYEGDILKFNTKGGNEMIYQVKWKGKGFKPTRMSEDNQEEIEIIGNIYENQELLSSN